MDITCISITPHLRPCPSPTLRVQSQAARRGKATCSGSSCYPVPQRCPWGDSSTQGQPIPASELMMRRFSASSCNSFSLSSSFSISRTLALMASSS